MAFDFMKNFMMLEDEEKFANFCESLEEIVREAQSGDDGFSEFEIMQALEYVGFNVFRDDWEEFKKMDVPRELGYKDTNAKGRMLIN